MRQAFVHRLGASAPDDVAPLAAAIADGRVLPEAIVAILGKTEGNGCVNDFSRGLAAVALRGLLGRYLAPEAVAEVPLAMSGGTEGGLAPHWLVLEARPATGGVGPALAVGRARTPRLEPWEVGRREQIEAVAAAVRTAVTHAEIAGPADVHYVQVKCPLLTGERIARAEAAGHAVATRDTLRSMGLSRGAAALGVACALGELPRQRIWEAAVGGDLALWSSVASCSAGTELEDNEIVVLGTSRAWTGPLRIDHAVMADGFDVEPVRGTLERLGFAPDGQLHPEERGRLAAVLAKAEPSRSGRLRGCRHTMLDDSDVAATRHARALVGGVLGGLVGHGELFVSGGAEHQGPDGGGPVALIAATA
jgi:cyanuric acid amidohydrolase